MHQGFLHNALLLWIPHQLKWYCYAFSASVFQFQKWWTRSSTRSVSAYLLSSHFTYSIMSSANRWYNTCKRRSNSPSGPTYLLYAWGLHPDSWQARSQRGVPGAHAPLLQNLRGHRGHQFFLKLDWNMKKQLLWKNNSTEQSNRIDCR